MPGISTRLLLIVLPAAAGLACQRPTPPFVDAEPRLAVHSEFSSNRILEVQVSRTVPLFGERPDDPFVRDAAVRIYHGEHFLEQLELDDARTSPVYVSRTLTPEPAILYRIDVSAPGFRPVTAHSSIPRQILIRQLQVGQLQRENADSPNGSNVSYSVSVDFDDPAGELNYYHLKLYQQILSVPVDGQDEPGGLVRLVEPNFPQLSRGLFIPAKTGGLLFTDEYFNGEAFSYSIPLRFQVASGETLGRLLVELRAVSADYYFFQKSITQQDGPGQPIQGETPLYNNIQNGEGIFAGYNYFRDSILVIQ